MVYPFGCLPFLASPPHTFYTFFYLTNKVLNANPQFRVYFWEDSKTHTLCYQSSTSSCSRLSVSLGEIHMKTELTHPRPPPTPFLLMDFSFLFPKSCSWLDVLGRLIDMLRFFFFIHFFSVIYPVLPCISLTWRILEKQALLKVNSFPYAL